MMLTVHKGMGQTPPDWQISLCTLPGGGVVPCERVGTDGRAWQEGCDPALSSMTVPVGEEGQWCVDVYGDEVRYGTGGAPGRPAPGGGGGGGAGGGAGTGTGTGTGPGTGTGAKPPKICKNGKPADPADLIPCVPNWWLFAGVGGIILLVAVAGAGRRRW